MDRRKVQGRYMGAVLGPRRTVVPLRRGAAAEWFAEVKRYMRDVPEAPKSPSLLPLLCLTGCGPEVDGNTPYHTKGAAGMGTLLLLRWTSTGRSLSLSVSLTRGAVSLELPIAVLLGAV